MATTPIAIFGAGGFAREVLQIILDINDVKPTWDVAGFLVSEAVEAPETVHGYPVISGLHWLKKNRDAEIVIAVGSSAARSRIASKLAEECKSTFATLVHPRSWVGRKVMIGQGSIVCAGVQITTDVRIGNHVHINIGCSVGHDAILENYVTLNPSVSVSGNVKISEGAQVGTGTVLIPYANVGVWSILGAGSVVTKPLEGNVTAVGAPARVVKVRQPGWHSE